jgi:molybdate transport system ATP-binding protein
VLVLNRFDEIPDFIQHAGVLADCNLTETGEKTALLKQALIAQLAHSEQLDGITLPEPDAPSARHALRSPPAAHRAARWWSLMTIARSLTS